MGRHTQKTTSKMRRQASSSSSSNCMPGQPKQLQMRQWCSVYFCRQIQQNSVLHFLHAMWLHPSIFWMGAEQLGHFLHIFQHILYLEFAVDFVQVLLHYFIAPAFMQSFQTQLTALPIALGALESFPPCSRQQDLAAVGLGAELVIGVHLSLNLHAYPLVAGVGGVTKKSLGKTVLNGPIALIVGTGGYKIARLDIA